MLYPNVHIFANHFRLIDAATIGITMSGVWTLGVAAQWWPAETGLAFLTFASGLVVAFVIIADRIGVYYARRTERMSREFFSLFEVTVTSVAIGALLAEIFTAGLPGVLYAACLASALAVLLSIKFVLRFIIRSLRRRGRELRHWLVVGVNQRSERIINDIQRNPHYGINVLRLVDIRSDECKKPASTRQELRGRAPLADLPLTEISSPDEFRTLLSDEVVDEVVVTLPVRSYYDELVALISLCEEAGISVRMDPTLHILRTARTTVAPVGESSMVTFYTGPEHATSLLLKRLLDLVLATAGLLLLSPLMLAIAIAVGVSSPGPILFWQTRLGLHGRPFQMVKFRSMCVDAPLQRETLVEANEADGPVFKIRNDPRITPIGRWLRKYHLDELPQLWNVLLGEMSLVGPRPLPPEEARGDEWWHRRRLSMPPGLTCYWQMQGDHGIEFPQWMRMDLEYIDRWSLKLDLYILWRTVRTLKRGTGC